VPEGTCADFRTDGADESSAPSSGVGPRLDIAFRIV